MKRNNGWLKKAVCAALAALMLLSVMGSLVMQLLYL